jgi:DNA-binding MarR family transcriptional regulator
MTQKNDLNSQASRCSCTTLRKASRRISQLYDAALAPSGLKTTQRAILAQIRRSEATTVGNLAEALVMDAGALAHTLKPLERDGLISIDVDPDDRRNRAAKLTPADNARLSESDRLWENAHRGFDAHKRVKGRKRHILVDSFGQLIACRVEPADIPDRKAAGLLLGGLGPLFPNIRTVIADAGHQSRKLARGAWIPELIAAVGPEDPERGDVARLAEVRRKRSQQRDAGRSTKTPFNRAGTGGSEKRLSKPAISTTGIEAQRQHVLGHVALSTKRSGEYRGGLSIGTRALLCLTGSCTRTLPGWAARSSGTERMQDYRSKRSKGI